jgi:hypothetical protein
MFYKVKTIKSFKSSLNRSKVALIVQLLSNRSKVGESFKTSPKRSKVE